jgi:hypothetical protein
MKRKIFRPLIVLGIGVVTTVNVQLNSNKSTGSLLLDNIEALSEEATPCQSARKDTNTTEWTETISDPDTGYPISVVCSRTKTTCEGSGHICCTDGTSSTKCGE